MHKNNLMMLSLAIAAAMFIFAGCTPADPAGQLTRDSNESNCARLANLYTRYQSSNNWTGPKDELEFKTFVKGFDVKRAELMGFDPANADDLFISERDKQPFKILWGVTGTPFEGPRPVVFEETGVDSGRMVGFTSGRPKEVTDAAEYDDMLAGNYTPPQRSRDTLNREQTRSNAGE